MYSNSYSNIGYRECVEDIENILLYTEKIARGLIVQIECKDECVPQLHSLLEKISRHLIKLERHPGEDVYDLEFDTCSAAMDFQKLISKRNIKIQKDVRMCGRSYPKPTVNEIQTRKEFLIRENCLSLIRNQTASSY